MNQQTFPVKGQEVNIFDFLGHTVFIATIQLCCCSARKGTDSW